ncbi:hypothetical protein EJ08DRAFT_44104 [Tothia fuscella]|uniref:Uncharacterized protein n=1 Tax=Tothia fuscella TaxID=1048955 RepID=A0A9P4TS79_9PEZI|nr:hypothetical protein EJ08DRAFT_44104 [Tothia fuscella]
MSQHPTTSLVCLLSFFLSISFASSSSLSTDDTQAQSLIVPTIERIGGSSQSRNGAENFAKLPQIKVTSVFNETLGSRVHTSGCWEFPAFFTAVRCRPLLS